MPTWFLTLSADELNRLDFHIYLNKRKGNHSINEEDFKKLTKRKKQDNLREDPVFAN